MYTHISPMFQFLMVLIFLNGVNKSIFTLGVMDLNLVLQVEKPTDITILGTAEGKTRYKN